jgi:type IV secretion system protein VirD4
VTQKQRKTVAAVILALLFIVCLISFAGVAFTIVYFPHVQQVDATATASAQATMTAVATAQHKKTGTHPKAAATPTGSASNSHVLPLTPGQEQSLDSFFQSRLFFYLVGIAFLVLGGALLVMFKNTRKTSSAHGSAQFATKQELRISPSIMAITPRQEQRARREAQASGRVPPPMLVIGMNQGRIIALTAERQEYHVMVIAPTGKGKTAGIFLPALLREYGTRSLLINDTKGELVEKAMGALAQHHACFIFAPSRPESSHYYNPLAHIHFMEDAEDLANSIVMNTGKSREPFWNNAPQLLLTAAILHLVETETDPPLSRLADVLTESTLPELKALLLTSPSELARSAAKAFVNGLNENPKLAGDILVEMATRLLPLKNPGIRQVTGRNEIDFDRMIDTPTAVFLSIPASEVKRLKWLSSAFIMQMMKRLMVRAEQSPGKRLPHGMAFYLDEFCNAGHIPNFTQHISLVRSMGLAFILAIQDFGQLEEVYEEKGQGTILANTTTHIVFPGCGADETEYYSKRMGETTVLSYSQSENSRNAGFGIPPERTYTQGETRRRLMTPDELRTMELGKVMVLADNMHPMIVQNRPNYGEAELKQRVNLPYTLPSRPAPRQGLRANRPTAAQGTGKGNGTGKPGAQETANNLRYFQDK